MDNNCNMKWLEWAKELQFLAQVGLTYTKDDFPRIFATVPIKAYLCNEFRINKSCQVYAVH